MTSIRDDEIEKFSHLAEQWWDPTSRMATVLHEFNPVRLSYIREKACRHFGLDERCLRPLEGVNVLDVGCGAGLLCEPLARLGAHVEGIDPAPNNIRVARAHAAPDLDIRYDCMAIEDFALRSMQFDIVLCMEVVEHVSDVGSFLGHCSAMVKPGGLIFCATLNRTSKSFLLGILCAEYILRWLPRGLHDWNKFLTPQELSGYLEAEGLVSEAPVGVAYDLFTNSWRRSDDVAVNYMLVALKTCV